jgi:hypothetical protein
LLQLEVGAVALISWDKVEAEVLVVVLIIMGRLAALEHWDKVMQVVIVTLLATLAGVAVVRGQLVRVAQVLRARVALDCLLISLVRRHITLAAVVDGEEIPTPLVALVVVVVLLLVEPKILAAAAVDVVAAQAAQVVKVLLLLEYQIQ